MLGWRQKKRTVTLCCGAGNYEKHERVRTQLRTRLRFRSLLRSQPVTMHSLLLLSLLFVSLSVFADAQMCPAYGQCFNTRTTLMGKFIRVFQPYGSTVPVSTVTERFHLYATDTIAAYMGYDAELLVAQCVQQGATVFNSAYMVKNCSCIPDCSVAGVLDMWIGNANAGVTFN